MRRCSGASLWSSAHVTVKSACRRCSRHWPDRTPAGSRLSAPSSMTAPQTARARWRTRREGPLSGCSIPRAWRRRATPASRPQPAVSSPSRTMTATGPELAGRAGRAVLGSFGARSRRPHLTRLAQNIGFRYLSQRNPLAPLPAVLLRSRHPLFRLRTYLREGVGPSRRPPAGAELYSVAGANMAFAARFWRSSVVRRGDHVWR